MTVQEVLKATGFTDAEIAAMDAKAITAFSGVLTSAEQAKSDAAANAAKAEADRQAAKAAQDAAELAQRSNAEFYETKIVPGLTSWEEEQKRLLNELANEKAAAAFYKTQNEAARTAGFVANEAPAFVVPTAPPAPVRDASGRYVAGAPGGTPGSPTFTMEDVRNGIGSTMGVLSDIQWKHQQLFGKPLPISPTDLVRQAEAQKLDPMAYASRTFNFPQREQELAQQSAKQHDDSIAAAATLEAENKWKAELDRVRAEQAAKDKARAEAGGSNPDVRMAPGSSKFAEVARAVKEGTLPDPLKMSDAERRRSTRQQIHTEIAERETTAA